MTGITGFLGAHVANILLNKNYLVRGTVRSTANKSKLECLKKLPNQNKLEIV